MPWTYIIECADGTYYVGSTRLGDVAGRVWQHNHSELGARYTRRRRPVRLRWAGWFDRIDDAFALEKQVQGWNRRKREALMRGEWEALPRLAKRPSAQRRLRESESGFEAQAVDGLRTSTTGDGG